MIPIVSWLNLISALLCATLLIRVLRGYLKSKKQTIKYFVFFYLCFSLFFIMLATPGIIHGNAIDIAFDAALGYFILFLAVAFLIRIPVVILGKRNWQDIISWFIIFIGAIVFILNWWYLKPVQIITKGNISYYLVQERLFVRLMVGGIPLLLALMTGLFFVLEGRMLIKKSRDKQNDKEQAPGIAQIPEDNKQITESAEQLNHEAHRSYWIASGMFILLASGIFNFVIYTFSPSPYWFVASSILANSGLLVIAKGMFR